mmetsp:Transcript_12881/g.28446  ORF Transcript_12881/g.28446 Transcript_12881/m.28446 type:complete len:90 (+) Transcript_12881:47-316(+)
MRICLTSLLCISQSPDPPYDLQQHLQTPFPGGIDVPHHTGVDVLDELPEHLPGMRRDGGILRIQREGDLLQPGQTGLRLPSFPGLPRFR